MSRYAANTTVSSEKSRAEIESTLRRYGCREFGYSISETSAQVGFRMKNLSIRFTLPMPDRKDFVRSPQKGFARTGDTIERAWEQATRQRWRALALCIKAKLEAVECGISTLENEFLAYVVLDDDKTIGERLVPQLVAIAEGRTKLLPFHKDEVA